MPASRGSFGAWVCLLGAWWSGAWLHGAPVIDACSPASGPDGTLATVTGRGFGAEPGSVAVGGRRITPRFWSDARITFTVPEDAVTGGVRVRDASGARSAAVSFAVNRTLPAGQIAPYGLVIEETGLLGSAFLVETDGTCLYGICGFETLDTYELHATRAHALRSRVVLNRRVADLRVRGGYLFCVGDHGLVVFRCADLRAGTPTVVAALAGGSCLSVDARTDPAGEVDGLLVALSEHAPRWGTNTLRVAFYRFAEEEFTLLGTFKREVGPDERQFAVALDPTNRKAYVSGWGSARGRSHILTDQDSGEWTK